jgi:hypothetical protein
MSINERLKKMIADSLVEYSEKLTITIEIKIEERNNLYNYAYIVDGWTTSQRDEELEKIEKSIRDMDCEFEKTLFELKVIECFGLVLFAIIDHHYKN